MIKEKCEMCSRPADYIVNILAKNQIKFLCETDVDEFIENMAEKGFCVEAEEI